jgi:hypothetical protein
MKPAEKIPEPYLHPSPATIFLGCQDLDILFKFINEEKE